MNNLLTGTVDRGNCLARYRPARIGGVPVAKEDWGTKRLCQSCATKFYDFGRTPIVCPKCATTFDPETLLKSRRTRPSASKMAKVPKPATVPVPAKSEDNDIDAGVNDVDDEDKVVLDENDDDAGGFGSRCGGRPLGAS